jgi:SAM-dependent methyltransferase
MIAGIDRRVDVRGARQACRVCENRRACCAGRAPNAAGSPSNPPPQPKMNLLKPLKLLLLAATLVLGGCASTNYGDEQYRLRMAIAGKDIIWVPSKLDMVHKMLDAAQVTRQDIVYDLGSGDGIIPIEAARKYGVRAVGIEYNPDLVALSQRNAKRAQLEALVTFKRGDIFVEDFSEATVVTLYLGEALNAKLMPRLLAMRPGTRVVSNIFRIESWTPDQVIRSDSGEQAFLWTVPARIEGRWSFAGAPDLPNLSMQVRQKKQFFDAQIFAGGTRIALIEDSKINGSRISLDFARGSVRYQLQGEVQGQRFTGLLNGSVPVTGTLSP